MSEGLAPVLPEPLILLALSRPHNIESEVGRPHQGGHPGGDREDGDDLNQALLAYSLACAIDHPSRPPTTPAASWSMKKPSRDAQSLEDGHCVAQLVEGRFPRPMVMLALSHQGLSSSRYIMIGPWMIPGRIDLSQISSYSASQRPRLRKTMFTQKRFLFVVKPSPLLVDTLVRCLS